MKVVAKSRFLFIRFLLDIKYLTILAQVVKMMHEKVRSEVKSCESTTVGCTVVVFPLLVNVELNLIIISINIDVKKIDLCLVVSNPCLKIQSNVSIFKEGSTHTLQCNYFYESARLAVLTEITGTPPVRVKLQICSG